MMPLTVLTTARLRGALDGLPRLFSLIRRVRAGVSGPTLLLDLGESCHPAVVECAATAGRATLFVLDAMGYDLACLTAAECARLPAEAARKLLERVTMGLCGAAPAGLPPADGLPPVAIREVDGLRVALIAPPEGEIPLPPAEVIFRPAPGQHQPRAEGRLIRLPLVEGGRLGVLTVNFGEDGLPVGGLDWRTEPMLPGLHGDATVAATVAFIRDEIRHYRPAE